MNHQAVADGYVDKNSQSCAELFVCGDIDEATEIMSRAYAPHTITNLSRDSGFRIDHRRLAVNHSSINTLTYATRTRITASPLEKYFLVFFSLRGSLLIDDRRLECARDRLIEAEAGDGSVTQVALDCGFSHLGRFSRDYQDRFGEKPFQTLRTRDH